MCGEIGKWLRIAGYDTKIINNSVEDTKILQQTTEEDRFLITKDAYFVNQHEKVIFLKEDSLDKWAKELKKRGVDWLFAPFSRCVKCNSLLQKMSNPPIDMLGSKTDHTQEFWSCPSCGQIFWLGSHTTKMEKQLKRWNQP